MEDDQGLKAKRPEVGPRTTLGGGIAISRDGSHLVLSSGPGFVVRHREKSALERLEIGPPCESVWPFLSPDGRWLGYSGDGAIKKVPVTGGSPVELVKVATQGSGAWPKVTLFMRMRPVCIVWLKKVVTSPVR